MVREKDKLTDALDKVQIKEEMNGFEVYISVHMLDYVSMLKNNLPEVRLCPSASLLSVLVYLKQCVHFEPGT